MEKNIINIIQKSLPTLFTVIKKQKKNYFSVDYDNEADVMYIAFDENKKAGDTEVYSDDILVRRRDNDLVGLTVLHASSLLKHN